MNDNTPIQTTTSADDICTLAPYRVGFVALLGKPNVGKSTLFNTLLGQKYAIVSPRPQTTRLPLRGILNRPDAQVIFIDTPGMHEPRHRLGHLMVKLARQSLKTADLICLLVDITTPPSKLDKAIANQVRHAQVPSLLLLNKIDLPYQKGHGQNLGTTQKQHISADNLQLYRSLGNWTMELALSARTGTGVSAVVDEIIRHLPPGEPLYPEDYVVDQSERTLVADLVREKVLLFAKEEVPHAVAVEVEEWIEQDHVTYIRMTVNVEKESQKRILIGTNGGMLKRIGSAARIDIETLLARPVYLDLWIKVRRNWRNDPSLLGWLGYHAREQGTGDS